TDPMSAFSTSASTALVRPCRVTVRSGPEVRCRNTSWTRSTNSSRTRMPDANTLETVEIRPQPGPQEMFLATAADIAFYGGSAGSGKSFATVIDPLRHVHRPGFRGVMFRREMTRLIGAGSLWEETQRIYPLLGAASRMSPVLEWRWPSGAVIEMRHLQHDKDKHAHQGKQYAGIYFDEVTEFEEAQFWYLISRL